MMNKKEVESLFKQCYPNIKEIKDKHERILIWDFFTDGLCKDGKINDRQYASWKRPNYIAK